MERGLSWGEGMGIVLEEGLDKVLGDEELNRIKS